MGVLREQLAGGATAEVSRRPGISEQTLVSSRIASETESYRLPV
jgi:hypothetical protein